MENQRFGRENSKCKQTADKSKQSADKKVNKQLTFKGLKRGIMAKKSLKNKDFSANCKQTAEIGNKQLKM